MSAVQNLVTIFNQLVEPTLGSNFFSVGAAQEIRADNIPIPRGLIAPSMIHIFASENNLPVAQIATGSGSIVISLGTITPEMEAKIASLLG